jgi:nucleotide-binding universal stress UspA family protein
MYRSVLVPLDGSPFGEQALPLALALARRCGATLHLVHVLTPVVVYPDAVLANAGLEAQIHDRQKDYLDGVARRVAAISTVPVRTALLDGAISPTLQDHVAAAGIDLVVMTTHGRSPLGRFWLGSVADYLVRHLNVPLLLVRPHDSAPDLQSDPVPRHILVPLDGSALAEDMIEPAAALAALTEGSLTLLRVVRPALPSNFSLDSVGVGAGAQQLIDEIEKVHQQLMRQASAYLEGVADRLRSRNLVVRTRVGIEDQPALAILLEAKASGADLIALQTHGRGGLARLLLGSVADKVIRGAAVPVLVRRPPRS